ncbi:MAG: ribosomal protein S18-alanine N-acetyltransferase [Clostridia bacterium]|nr:ribosomal protein S18-alanine N-acetyltransferase [Clostridia bacterium]
MTEIVPLTAEHLPALAEIELASFSEPWSASALEILLKDGGFGVVATIDGIPVAYGGMTTVLDEGSITNIATLPEYRGRGLGHKVVGALLAEAKQRGVTAVFLEVRPSNVPARTLYRSEGFSEIGVRKNFYRLPTEDAILMVWREENKEETQ